MIYSEVIRTGCRAAKGFSEVILYNVSVELWNLK